MSNQNFIHLLDTFIKTLSSYLELNEELRTKGLIEHWKKWVLLLLQEHFGPNHILVYRFLKIMEKSNDDALRDAKSLLLEIKNAPRWEKRVNKK